MAGVAVVLGYWSELLEFIEGLYDEFCAEVRQLFPEDGCGICWFIGMLSLVEHIAGVHSFVHLHDAHTGFCFAVDDGPVDGSCATVGWKQAGVRIDTAQSGGVQQISGIRIRP